MTEHRTKVVEIYSRFFMHDHKTPFSQRIKKAKKESLEYINNKVNNPKNDMDLQYWKIVAQYAKKL